MNESLAFPKAYTTINAMLGNHLWEYNWKTCRFYTQNWIYALNNIDLSMSPSVLFFLLGVAAVLCENFDGAPVLNWHFKCIYDSFFWGNGHSIETQIKNQGSEKTWGREIEWKRQEKSISAMHWNIMYKRSFVDNNNSNHDDSDDDRESVQTHTSGNLGGVQHIVE